MPILARYLMAMANLEGAWNVVVVGVEVEVVDLASTLKRGLTIVLPYRIGQVLDAQSLRVQLNLRVVVGSLLEVRLGICWQQCLFC